MYVAFFLRIWVCSALKEQPRPKTIRREISAKQKPSREIIHHFFAGNILYHVCLKETHLRRNVWKKILTKRYQKRTFCLYKTKTLQRSVPPFLCCKTLPNTSIFKGHPYREMFQEENTTRRYQKRTISQTKSLQRHVPTMFFRQRFYTANFLRKRPYQKMWKKEIQPKHIRREISTKQNLSGTLSSTTCVSKKHMYGEMFGDKSPRKDIKKELSVSTKQKLYRDLFHHFFVAKHCLTQVFSRDTPTEKCFKKNNKRYQERNLSQTKSLQRHVPTMFFRQRFYTIIFGGNIRTKICEKKSNQNISEEKSLPNKILSETLSTSFLLETFSTTRNVWGKIHAKRYQKRTLHRTKSLQRSVPPFLCCKTLPNASIFKGHPYREMFQEKKHNQNISEENYLTNKIFAETFLHHVLPTEILYRKFLEETSVPKNVEKRNPTKTYQKRNLYQTKSFRPIILYHVCF